MIRERLTRFARSPTRNRSLSNIGRARCAAINSDFFKIIISKYINYTIGINDNNCVFVCNLILGWTYDLTALTLNYLAASMA